MVRVTGGSLTDGAAAERYTEAKISQLGMKMLECMDVADYVPNYTGEFKEPIVLTTRVPNFFINECAGIAVGLSCNIPAHNLKEIVEAMKVVVKKGESTKIKDIMKYIKGPDYKYGGKILSTPKEIEDIINKCTKKEPNDRYSNVEEFYNALCSVKNGGYNKNQKKGFFARLFGGRK